MEFRTFIKFSFLTNIAAFAMALWFSSAASAAPVTFNVDGVITTSAGTPLEEASVPFNIEIKSPSTQGSCLLYKEQFTVTMTGSNGYFSIPIGKSANVAAGAYSLEKVLGDEEPLTGLSGCSGGMTSYTPAAGEDRQIVITFTDTNGVHTFSAQDIKAVPFAVRSKTSESVAGYTPTLLMKVDSGVSQSTNTNTAMSQTQYDELWRLIKNPATAYLSGSNTAAGDVTGTFTNLKVTKLQNIPVKSGVPSANDVLRYNTGTSQWEPQALVAGSVTNVTSANNFLTVTSGTTTPSLTVNVGTSANTVAAGDDSRFTDARAPTGAAGGELSGTYPNPTIAKIAAKPLSITGLSPGQVLSYDGTNWINAAVSDSSKLPTAGGTMTGAIDMGSQNLTSTGYITMSANKSLHLSNNSADPAGLAPADKGKIWFNSASNDVRYWDGSAVKTVGLASAGGFDVLSPNTSKGDITVHNGTTNVRLQVGTDNTVLMADSTQAKGVKWTSLPASSDASYGTKGIVSFNTDAATSGISVSAGVAQVNYGTSANQLVRLDSGAKLPAVDGSALTNIIASSYNGILPIIRGGTNSSYGLTNDKIMVSAGGSIVESAGLMNGQILIGGTGIAPAVGNITGSAGVVVTNGANSIALSTDAVSTNTASKLVTRDASGNFAAGTITNNSNILKGATSGTVTMAVPASITSYTLTWPNAVGGAGSFLTTDALGNLSWGSPAAISDSTYTSKGAVQFLTDAATSGITIASGVANVNAGTSANQIVKLDGSAKLPAVDASSLTNLNAANVSSGILPIARGGTNSSFGLTNNRIMISTGGSIVESASLTNGQILIGGTGIAPAAANITGSAGVVVTNGSNSIALTTDAVSTNTASKLVTRDGSGNFAANAITNTSNILKASSSGSLTMTVPATVTPYTITWPNAVGGAGTFLSTDSSGVLSWVSPAAPLDASYSTKGVVQFATDAATSGISITSGVASVNVGTGANQIVKLTSLSKYPGADGSLITNLSASNLSGSVAIANGGTGQSTKTAAFDGLSPNTNKGDIAVHNGTNNVRLPAGTDGFVLTADAAQTNGVKWAASPGAVNASYSAKGVVQILTDSATSGLTVSSGVLNVNSGTTANQIVKLDGSAKLPAVDGSALTNLSAANISTGFLPVARGGTGTTGFTGDKMVVANVTGDALQSFNCNTGDYVSFTAGGATTCGNANYGSSFVKGGNSFGAGAALGTGDGWPLTLQTNGFARVTITSTGSVGIGTTGPNGQLDVAGGSLTAGIFTNAGGSSAPTATFQNTATNGPVARFVANGGPTSFMGGKVGIGLTSPTATLEVAGTVKVGTSGNAISAMGMCTFTGTLAGSGETTYSCTGIPGNTNVVVACSPTTALAGAAGVVFRNSGTADTVTSKATTSVSSATWNCMWMLQ